MISKSTKQIVSMLLALALVVGILPAAGLTGISVGASQIGTSGVVITTTALDGGKVGVAYSQTLGASGSYGTITWSLGKSGDASAANDLPDGLGLNQSTGEISGTPATEGTTAFWVTASDSSTYDCKELSITIAPASAEDTPAAGIDYIYEMLTGLVDGAKYSFNGGAEATQAGTSYALEESWYGTTLSIVRKASGSGKTDSSAQLLQIPARPSAPAVSATAETSAGTGGTITGVTSAMEYKLVSAVNWTSCPGTTVTGLAAGTYSVRVKAVANASFSGKEANVTVAAYTPQAVTGVTLNKTSTTIAVGWTETLTATVTPGNAANREVAWSSSNNAVATVNNGVVMGVAPGTATITATSVADSTKKATCTVTVSADTIRGTAYLYSGGVKNLGGAYVYVYNEKGNYVGSASTDSSGKYTVAVPASQRTATYRIDASSNFILGRLRLNKDKTAIENGQRIVTEAEAAAGVDFFFVDPPKVRGKIVDSLTKSPLAEAYVSVWDGVKSGADGTFLAQSYISQTGENSVYVSVSKDGYYYVGKQISCNVTVDSLKNGQAIDVGEIGLTKINTGGVFGDYTKNNLMLVPNTVTSGEISNATLNIYADQANAITSAKIKVTADSGAVIKVKNASQVRVMAGGKKVDVADLSVSDSEMVITLDIQPRTQYQITFGVQAPADLKQSGYQLQAFVGDTQIGQQVATIHNLTVTAPAEIGFADPFTVYGEITSSADVKLVLNVISPTGEKLNFLKETQNNAGFFYKFEDVTVPGGQTGKYPYGEYTIEVAMYSKQGNELIAEAFTTMLITDKPVKVKAMSLRDDYNTVSATDPKPGSFLTFVGWVDGTLWSMDYRNLQASVELTNADEVQSARFIMHTTHGEFTWNAVKSGANFAAKLPKYQGTGKAAVSFEYTKKDGSVSTYTIGNIIILIDPSGYVYDKTTNKRIEGAKATLYYKTAAGNWEFWPAEDYMQVNPQFTDKDGKYGWMVSEGEYEVRVTADGYEDYSTLGEYDIAVLPERKDINIGLTPVRSGGPVIVGGSSGSGGGGSGGSSGGGSTGAASSFSAVNAPSDVTVTAATNAAKAAAQAAKAAGTNTAVITLKNPGNISLEALQAMVKAAGMAVKLNADSMSADGKTVEVRITLDPSKAAKGLNLSASVTGATAQARKAMFEKWFGNTVSVVSLGQKDSFGQPVEISVKAGSKLDVKNLVLYSYNASSNTYARIENPACWLDKNGYLHFTTTLAGDIIISDKPLVRK